MGSLALQPTMGSYEGGGWGVGVGLLGGSRDQLYLGMVAPSQVLCQARRLAGWKRAKSCDLNCIWKNGSQISSAFFLGRPCHRRNWSAALFTAFKICYR